MTDDQIQTVTAICSCGQQYDLGPEYFGMVAECSACGADIDVPEPDDTLYEDIDLVDYTCEHCSVELEIPTAWLGHSFPCPSCDKEISLPAPLDQDEVHQVAAPEPMIEELAPAIEIEQPFPPITATPGIDEVAETPAPNVETHSSEAIEEIDAQDSFSPDIVASAPATPLLTEDVEAEESAPAVAKVALASPDITPLLPQPSPSTVHKERKGKRPAAVKKTNIDKRRPTVVEAKPSKPLNLLGWLAGVFILGIAGFAIFLGIQIYKEKNPSRQTDSSLDVASYTEAGLPAHDKIWGSEDYAKAASVFSAISSQTAGQLPLYKSKNSGLVFQRLIAKENLAFIQDTESDLKTRIEEGFVLKQAIAKIVNSYTAGMGDDPVFAERAELYLFAIDMHQRFIQLIDIEAQPTFSRDPQFMAKSMQTKQAHRATQVEYITSLFNMSTHEDLPNKHHHDILEKLTTTLPSIIQNVTSDELGTLRDNLNSVIDSTADEDRKAQLNALKENLF